MANQITSNGTFSIGDSSGTRGSFNLALSLTMTGSNLTLDIKNIPSGSWTPLNTGSISDLRYAVFQNSGEQNIIIGGTNGAGLQPMLRPGDFFVFPYSGSTVPQLFAQGGNNLTQSLLEYGITEQ
jgi:hypothetical protein